MISSVQTTKPAITRVTLVDDNPDDIELFCYLIENNCSHGISLSTYIGAEELLTDFSSNPLCIPDVLFLDINMPKLSGLECLKKLRNMAQCSNMRIIMYSTSQSDSDVSQSQMLGADLYLSKPSDIKIMMEILCKLIHIDWATFVADKFVH